MLTVFFISVYGPIVGWALAALGTGFEDGAARFGGLPDWYLGLTIVIVAGGEEWLYRGHAIERLQVLTGNAWSAGAISLVVFVVVHLPVWGVGPSLTTVVSGGILTALYVWRRDILCLILAHVATDLYGLVVAR